MSWEVYPYSRGDRTAFVGKAFANLASCKLYSRTITTNLTKIFKLLRCVVLFAILHQINIVARCKRYIYRPSITWRYLDYINDACLTLPWFKLFVQSNYFYLLILIIHKVYIYIIYKIYINRFVTEPLPAVYLVSNRCERGRRS